jgi:hypothetical protein
MPKLPDTEVVLHGILTSVVDRIDFETKKPDGRRQATILGADGGAAVVNFGADQQVPFAPSMSQIVWRVKSSPWSMEGANSGMSTAFVAACDEAHLINLANVLTDNAARFPEAASSK